MSNIEKIRQEIERRRDFFYERYLQKGIGCIEETRYDECVEILSFIDSLPDCTVKTNGQGRVKDDVYDSLSEQKPEWSEEDSDILRDAICAADILAKDFKKDNPHLSKTLRVAKEWLESLPERFTLPIKQEWDGFDEDCLKRAIWYVENPAPSVVKDTNLALWLKSLPERFNLQPKPEVECDNETEIQKAYREGKNAGRKEVFDHPEEYGLQPRRMYDYETGKRNPEWSEEDERILKGIIGKIDHNQTYGVSKVEMLSFLEDLRPSWKPSEVCYGPKGNPDPAGVWKPSKEQMEALLNTLHPDDPYYHDLKSLYEQLKQL